MDNIEIVESIWVGRFTIVCSPELAHILRKVLEEQKNLLNKSVK